MNARFVLPWLASLLSLAIASSALAQDGGAPDGGVPDGGVPELAPDAGAPDAGEVAPDPDDGGVPPSPFDEPEGEPAADTEDGAAEGEPTEEEETGDEEAGEDDLFPEDGDISDLVRGDEDLEIPDVVVSGEAEAEREHDTGGAVERLDEEFLERFNFDNPNSVLMQVPGVYVRTEDGFGLRPNIGLRGVNADRSTRVTLLEDGVLFAPAAYAAPAAYYFPLMTRMTGVDVYLGAATIPYGPRTVGGAIDLRTREIPRELTVGVDLAVGTTWYGRTHAYAGGSNAWGGFLVEGVYLHTDGFKHIGDPQSDDYHDQSTGFDRGEIVLRGELHGAVTRDAYQRLELRLGLTGEVSNETYLGLSDEDFRADPFMRYPASALDRMEWWRTQVQLRHTLEVGDDFTLRTVAYRHDLDRRWNKVNGMGGLPQMGGAQARVDLYNLLQNPGGVNRLFIDVLRGVEDSTFEGDLVLIGTNARRFGNTGIQTDAVGRFVTGDFHHQLRGGLRLHHDDVHRHHTEDAYAMLAGQLVRQTDESYTLVENWAQALAFSAYLAWSVRWETVTITPGVRSELIWTSYTEAGVPEPADAFRAAVLPGGSIEWAIVPELTAFAGVMRGFTPVAPGQAEGVQPEDSITYELGARLQHRDSRTTGQVTGFVNDYSNFLAECSAEAGCEADATDTVSNAGLALIAGVEVRIATEPRVGDVRFPLRLAYTFTYSELRSAVLESSNPQFQGGMPGDHLPYVPEHQVSAQAGLELDVFGINLSASYLSPMWEAVGNGDELRPPPQTDPVFLLDATAYVRIFEGVRLYARGENLTLTQAIAARRPFGARPNRPFLVQVGLKIEL